VGRAVKSRQQKAGYHNVNIINNSFENLIIFKYLETTLANQNYIHQSFNSRLKSRNDCYHPVQKYVCYIKPKD
jgi:hypothetical protein